MDITAQDPTTDDTGLHTFISPLPPVVGRGLEELATEDSTDASPFASDLESVLIANSKFEECEKVWAAKTRPRGHAYVRISAPTRAERIIPLRKGNGASLNRHGLSGN